MGWKASVMGRPTGHNYNGLVDWGAVTKLNRLTVSELRHRLGFIVYEEGYWT